LGKLRDFLKEKQMSQKEIVVRVAPDYEPEDGDAFDAVQAALEHFGIPAFGGARQGEVGEDVKANMLRSPFTLLIINSTPAHPIA